MCDWEFPTTTNVMPTSFGLIATWLRHLKSYICYYVSEWIHLFFSSPHLEKQRDRIVKVGPKASLYLACVWITKLGFQRWSCWQFYKWINWHPIFPNRWYNAHVSNRLYKVGPKVSLYLARVSITKYEHETTLVRWFCWTLYKVNNVWYQIFNTIECKGSLIYVRYHSLWPRYNQTTYMLWYQIFNAIECF